MKKFVCILFLVWLLPGTVLGADLFKGEIERAAQGIVNAWTAGDLAAMKRSYKDLVLYETYQLSVGKWSPEESYLSHIPTGETNLSKVAAAIFIMRVQRAEGIDLNPRSFFANRRFEVQVQP
jgi:hypothetical protein